MELLQSNTAIQAEQETLIQPVQSSSRAFMEANTTESSLEELKDKHIIPVFIKDNEPLISQADFVEAMLEATASVFPGETILQPGIRLSHPIKGRIPEAKDKPAVQLQEHEKTLYYERMAFVIDLPTIHDEIDGHSLSLSVGGVKAYNQDNLYSKKGADEHFKIFIGFQNRVCTNLCVWTDGYMGDLKVSTVGQLRASIRSLLENYEANYHLHHLRQLSQYSLTEKQFALLIGRCRMYPNLPKPMQAEIPPMLLGDTQLGNVVKDYYKDNSFCRINDGEISLWRLYNLFTGVNKSSYIDTFLDRSVNAYQFTEQLKYALDNQQKSWFLN